MKKRVLLFCFFLCLLSGCKANEKNSANIQNRGNAIIRDGATKHYKRQSPYDNSDLVETPAEFDEKRSLTERRSQIIAESVTNVKGVDKASVVINNNSAIIGIEVSVDLDDAALMKLKRDVEKEVRVTDKKIDRVAVTASKELVERITKIADYITPEQSPVNPGSKAGKIIEQLTPVV